MAVAAAGECGPEVAQELVPRIQARYEAIRSLRAGFEQTSESATFGGDPLMSPETKRGRVVFAKPGRMHWTYEEPERSVVVSDGKSLWIHDVEERSVTRFEVTQGFLSGAALQFLLGDGRILDSFEVSVSACDGERVTLDLAPVAEATYERLGLIVHRRSADVVGTSVLDLFGNRTEIRFDGIEIDPTLEPGFFRPEIPDGVEVIEYDAAGPSRPR